MQKALKGKAAMFPKPPNDQSGFKTFHCCFCETTTKSRSVEDRFLSKDFLPFLFLL
jgi:hypothetical protein